jgi:hypothetical protein
MTTKKTHSIGDRWRALKGPLLVMLILVGFIIEFMVELPFRIVVMAAGRWRRP